MTTFHLWLPRRLRKIITSYAYQWLWAEGRCYHVWKYRSARGRGVWLQCENCGDCTIALPQSQEAELNQDQART